MLFTRYQTVILRKLKVSFGLHYFGITLHITAACTGLTSRSSEVNGGSVAFVWSGVRKPAISRAVIALPSAENV